MGRNRGLAARLELVLATAGRTADVDELVRDEHPRYTLYLEAFAAVTPDRAHELVANVLADPDVTMREAAILQYLDRIGPSGAPDELERFDAVLRGSDYPARRLRDWLEFRRADAGAPIDRESVARASDWLQLRLASGLSRRDALELLARDGRTRRIRAIASARL